jgi:hypothetical protein
VPLVVSRTGGPIDESGFEVGDGVATRTEPLAILSRTGRAALGYYREGPPATCPRESMAAHAADMGFALGRASRTVTFARRAF